MKIDVFGTTLTWENEQILAELKSRSINAGFINIKELGLVAGPKLGFIYASKAYELPDIVYCRGGFSVSAPAQGDIILITLDKLGVKVVDDSQAIITNKYKGATLARLEHAAILHPNSILAQPGPAIDVPFEKYVVKPVNGGKKAGMELIEGKKKYKPKEPVIIQEYIEAKGVDIRIHVIGNRVIGAMERSAKKGEWRSNVSLGGKAKLIKPSAKQELLALRATEACGIDVAGVDILTNEKGESLVLEVNRAPQFKAFMEITKINYPQKLVDYLIQRL